MEMKKAACKSQAPSLQTYVSQLVQKTPPPQISTHCTDIRAWGEDVSQLNHNRSFNWNQGLEHSPWSGHLIA